ncbi:MAG: diguanylate cyclase [Planctomycetia bacterium]|nr:diguanylate cyclase [Planctomycetia bacterium]
MRHLFPLFRLSIGFASLSVGILCLAFVFGLVPDRDQAVLQGRKSLSEALAIHCTAAVQQKEVDTLKETVPEIVRRNPDVLSAALRAADGNILVEVGEHQAHWDAAQTGPSEAQMAVPIALKDRRWGTVELRFRPLFGQGALGFLNSPAYRLLAFVGLVGTLVYFGYLWRVLGKLVTGDVGAVPKRIRATMDTLSEGVLILDKDHHIALANDAFARIVGQPAEKLEGLNASTLPWVRPQTAEEAPAAYPWEKSLKDAGNQKGVVLGLQTDGVRPRTLSINSMPIVNQQGQPRGVLATFDNLTAIEKKNSHLRKLMRGLKQSRAEIRGKNRRLKQLANEDPLTGCLNRRAFFAELEKHWQAALRYGYPLSCAILDVDQLATINEHDGERVGDEVLRHVAATLKATLRPSDRVGRYGGDEFCILLPHLDLDEAGRAAERCRQQLAASLVAGRTVTASFGVAAVGSGAEEPAVLLEQANQTLATAKRDGRNAVLCFGRSPDRATRKGLSLSRP